jgi:hypothetical protein
MMAPQLLDSSKPESVQGTPTPSWHPLIVVLPGRDHFRTASQVTNSCECLHPFSTPSWPALTRNGNGHRRLGVIRMRAGLPADLECRRPVALLDSEVRETLWVSQGVPDGSREQP